MEPHLPPDDHQTDETPDPDQARTELAALIAAMPDEAVEALLRLVRLWLKIHPHPRQG